jgi:hypothetical protein
VLFTLTLLEAVFLVLSWSPTKWWVSIFEEKRKFPFNQELENWTRYFAEVGFDNVIFTPKK